MTTLTRWNPFRTMGRFDPASDLEEMLRVFSLRPLMKELDNAAPELRIDVQEDGNTYRVKVDVPGVSKDDIQVFLEGNQVRIEAEFKREDTGENRQQVYAERCVGKSFRAFGLPHEIDADKSEAHHDGGVLTLTLPKKNSGQQKRLAIN